MSKTFAVLEKAALEATRLPHASPSADHPGDYGELDPTALPERASVVAVIGSNVASRAPAGAGSVTQAIAAELAAAGKRVVIVPVDQLLRINPLPLPDESNLTPGAGPNVWLWPMPSGQRLEFFRNRRSPASGGWLDALRGRFDAVLLDCPSGINAAGITEISAMADAAVLIVEAGLTLRQKLQSDQRALQLGGVKLAGCVWIWPEVVRR